MQSNKNPNYSNMDNSECSENVSFSFWGENVYILKIDFEFEFYTIIDFSLHICIVCISKMICANDDKTNNNKKKSIFYFKIAHLIWLNIKIAKEMITFCQFTSSRKIGEYNFGYTCWCVWRLRSMLRLWILCYLLMMRIGRLLCLWCVLMLRWRWRM